MSRSTPTIASMDATLIATRRPDLVELTLRSFRQNLFSIARFDRLYLNIDPLWGTTEDDKAVEEICRSYFPAVEIRRPETPSFGGAVRWAWSRPRSEWFLHLEDDWLLARRISASQLETELSSADSGQIHLANLSRAGRAQRVALPIVTSPAFVRTEFARIASSHMHAEMDPEKQFYDGHNPEGLAALRRFQTKFYGDATTPQLLFDTGRIWRKVRGIRKGLRGGTSLWMPSKRMRLPTVAFTLVKLIMEARLTASRFLPKA
jgi:hypothetical protein